MLLKKTCVPVCPRYSRDHYLFFIKEMYGNKKLKFFLFRSVFSGRAGMLINYLTI